VTIRNVVKGLKAPGAKKASARVAKHKLARRYVLTFTKSWDPSAEEVWALKSGLDGVKVLQEMPGTVLVEGEPAKVLKAVDPQGSWKVAPEGQFSA
jgi:hypothetical protein